MPTPDEDEVRLAPGGSILAIVPAYNEARSLPAVLDDLRARLEEAGDNPRKTAQPA